MDRNPVSLADRPKHRRLIADVDDVGRLIADPGAGRRRLVTHKSGARGLLHLQLPCDGGRTTSPHPLFRFGTHSPSKACTACSPLDGSVVAASCGSRFQHPLERSTHGISRSRRSAVYMPNFRSRQALDPGTPEPRTGAQPAPLTDQPCDTPDPVAFLRRRFTRLARRSASSGSRMKFSGCRRLATEMSSSMAFQ